MSDIQRAITKAAAELPEGWQIVVRVERGSGWVELRAPNGTKMPDPSPDMDLHEAINYYITEAQENEL